MPVDRPGESRRRLLSRTLSYTAATSLGALLPSCRSTDAEDHHAGKHDRHGDRDHHDHPRRHPRPQARLGLDTFTLHRSLTAKNPELRRDFWSVAESLDEYGLTGLQIDPSHFPGDDEATLDRLESIVKPKGHYVEFGMGGWDVNRLEERIKLTARFGGKAVRTFCGGEHDPPEKIEIYLKYAPGALHEAGAIAEAHNVDIAVENHGDFTSDQLKELLDKVDHPRVGACFDTANSLFRREDPITAAKTLAPYSKSMHLKDWVITFTDDGEPHWSERVLGEGEVPIAKSLKIILDRQPDLYIALETPVQIGENEKETVHREWEHFLACTRKANILLDAYRELHA